MWRVVRDLCTPRPGARITHYGRCTSRTIDPPLLILSKGGKRASYRSSLWSGTTVSSTAHNRSALSQDYHADECPVYSYCAAGGVQPSVVHS